MNGEALERFEVARATLIGVDGKYHTDTTICWIVDPLAAVKKGGGGGCDCHVDNEGVLRVADKLEAGVPWRIVDVGVDFEPAAWVGEGGLGDGVIPGQEAELYDVAWLSVGLGTVTVTRRLCRIPGRILPSTGGGRLHLKLTRPVLMTAPPSNGDGWSTSTVDLKWVVSLDLCSAQSYVHFIFQYNVLPGSYDEYLAICITS